MFREQDHYERRSWREAMGCLGRCRPRRPSRAGGDTARTAMNTTGTNDRPPDGASVREGCAHGSAGGRPRHLVPDFGPQQDRLPKARL